MTDTAVLKATDANRAAAATALRKLLPELVALSLNAKQAHWNVTGPAFLQLHELADELAATTAGWADRVAERTLALGFAVDARPATVAAVAGALPGGRLRDRESIIALGALIDRESIIALGALIDRLTSATRADLAYLEMADAVAHDIYVDVLEGLDKYRWMLRAHAQ